MQTFQTVIVIVAALASRPIEARLWRAGRLSDRTTALLVLGRMPALVLSITLIEGASIAFALVLTALACLVPAIAYRFMVDLLKEQRAEREKVIPTNR